MITSIKNPLIKEIRKLHQSKARHDRQELILEGTNLITAACEINYEINIICCTEDWQTKHPQLWQKATKKSQRQEVVTPEIMEAIATTVNPDGVIATAPRKYPRVSQLPPNLGLIIERLQDPGNLGTIIRTAVATGVDALWLSEDSVDLDHPKVLRASTGAWFKLSMGMTSSLSSLIKNYQQQGTQIIATLPQAEKTYWDLDLTIPSIILIGNEGAGLSTELASLADQRVKIPQINEAESLNVAIATALILYEALRQRMILQ
ncbi:RNA methyltransferase [Gloeocapsa sp. PCC 73106]|uniref:TrmH family RNA methyltransferase n=1 Tax=Gloeocapsa sp. PCC 73106 TaxID=102232 RepID=UPI0002AC635A|nr:RNA methyltransferase [Gloeocapsa sp. PCC 73106]ELR98037.1 rRNA methylase [Gloeocapsa sp. PCC 73106]